jgi:hypothetical protein
MATAIVAMFSLLVLYFTGVLNAHDTLGGFGDPLVVFIAALLVIGTSLEASSIGTWPVNFSFVTQAQIKRGCS